MSGPVSAAGIYLKVAAGQDKEKGDRETGERQGEKTWLCNEREDLPGERKHQASIPCVKKSRGPKEEEEAMITSWSKPHLCVLREFKCLWNLIDTSQLKPHRFHLEGVRRGHGRGWKQEEGGAGE